MLRAENLSIGYSRDKVLIKEINFDCPSSELILLLGINGIGKSTLLKTMCGLLAPISGAVYVGATDLAHMKPQERAMSVSAVFTGGDFDPYISIREFVSLGRHPYTDWLGRLNADDTRLIDAALYTLGLTDIAAQRVAQISDGQRQKALIARGLAQDTPCLILDEPTAFLDYKNKAELLSIIKSLTSIHGKTIVLSTHDISAALPFADRAFMITESGRFIESTTEGYTSDHLRAAMELA
jgi:iron complex transport system ATP-binding protein